MAIHVQVVDDTADESKIYLTVTTTNDDYPGVEKRFAGAFDVTLTAAQIQTQINTAVSLLWTAHGNPTWTVP